MPRLAVVIAFLLLCAPACAGDLDGIIAAAMKGTETPAMGVLVIRGGHVADQGAEGLRRNDNPEQVGLDDVWHIASDGKPMTATLIAKLVDRGLLSWNSTLADLLPDLAPHMRPEYRKVTLADLLSHRSGLPRDSSNYALFQSFYSDTRPLPLQRLTYVEEALKEAPVVPPETTFSYSNTGFILAAVIAERVTNMSYEDLMRQEVFQPLGMTSVGFGATKPGQNSGHVSGKPAPDAEANPLMFAPAGNMYMTLGDWAKFCIDQMAGVHGQGKLLKTATYHLMQTPIACTSNGLGWGVAETVLGRKGPALTHAGSDGNWYALVVLFPQTENGILIAANAGEDMGGDKAAKALLQALLPSLAPAR